MRGSELAFLCVHEVAIAEEGGKPPLLSHEVAFSFSIRALTPLPGPLRSRVWPKSDFSAILSRPTLPRGRTPIDGHTSLFTGVVPVDLRPSNRLDLSSPGQGG